MNWLGYAILAASFYGFFNFFIKLFADKISPSIALMIMAGTSFILATITTLVLKMTGQELTFSKGVIILPIAAGVFAGLAEIFYIFMFSKNVPISIGNPLVVGGTVLVAVILGLVALKEPLTTIKITGIAITLLGLVILSRS